MVIEFPKREDPMVRRLLSGKREGSNSDYELETFERELGKRFEVSNTERAALRHCASSTACTPESRTWRVEP